MKQIAAKVNGEVVKKTVSEWAKELGVRPALIYTRLSQKWKPADAVTVPVRPRRKRAEVLRKKKEELVRVVQDVQRLPEEARVRVGDVTFHGELANAIVKHASAMLATAMAGLR